MPSKDIKMPLDTRIDKINYQEIAQKAIVDYDATQMFYSFVALLVLVHSIKPKYILELGSCGGSVSWAFSRLIGNKGKVISVDVSMHRLKEDIKNDPKIRWLEMNSHDHKCLSKINQTLHGQKLDVLMIDGDHAYNGVWMDFNMYYPLVRQKGLIVMHDIHNRSFSDPGYVWKDLKDTGYNWFELYSYSHETNTLVPDIGVIIK